MKQKETEICVYTRTHTHIYIYIHFLKHNLICDSLYQDLSKAGGQRNKETHWGGVTVDFSFSSLINPKPNIYAESKEKGKEK